MIVVFTFIIIIFTIIIISHINCQKNVKALESVLRKKPTPVVVCGRR